MLCDWDKGLQRLSWEDTGCEGGHICRWWYKVYSINLQCLTGNGVPPQALGVGQQGWAQAVVRLQLERRSVAKRCKALLEETAATAGLALAASSHTLSRVPHFHRSGSLRQHASDTCCFLLDA